MIVDVKKFLIYGSKEEMDRFFELAQRAGFIEFIGSSRKKSLELSEEAKTLLRAIKIAKEHSVRSIDAPDVKDPFEVAERLLFFSGEHEKLLEEKRVLEMEASRVAIFGDFSKENLETVEREARRYFQFFCKRSQGTQETTLPSEMIFVGTAFDLDYFVAINKEKKRYPKMVEIEIEKPLGEIQERLRRIASELFQTEEGLRLYSNALFLLQEGLLEHMNAYHLRLAKHDAESFLQDSLFMIEAWIPSTRIASLFALIQSFTIEAEEIQIQQTDRVPTFMKNEKIAKVGEDLVQVYDTPSPSDRDPSLWVVVFFALFFAMIVADAGYGCIYLLIALFLRWKFPLLRGAKKRALSLFYILGGATVIWGVVTASYFGIQFSPTNPIQKTSILYELAVKKGGYHQAKKDDVYQEFVEKNPKLSEAKGGREFVIVGGPAILDEFYDNILMELSFLVGIFHIGIALLRSVNRNLANLGWVIFMVGGYLFFPSILGATTFVNFLNILSKEMGTMIGYPLTLAGIGLSFVLAFFQRKWGAFAELLNVVQVFADVLSYLRIYALSLGGMVMAHTFNDRLGIDFGIVASILVVGIGHINNILLTTMSAVIHGLRLNFLEWYHYGFDGGGVLFRPLKIQKME